MVLGWGIPVICQFPRVNQCAEMHRISCGRSERSRISDPMVCQLRRHALSSMAFMGLPCPRNSTGMVGDGLSDWIKGCAAACDISGVRWIGNAAVAASMVLRCISNYRYGVDFSQAWKSSRMALPMEVEG